MAKVQIKSEKLTPFGGICPKLIPPTGSLEYKSITTIKTCQMAYHFKCRTNQNGCSICKCSELEYISTKNSAYYASLDGVLYTKDLKELVKMPCGRKGEYIPDPETETIGCGAFCRSLLHTVRLSNKVKKIEKKAFLMASLQELHIHQERPEEIAIEEEAFDGLNNCILYVPIGTGYAYRHHPAFEGKFKEVIIERVKE